MDTPEGSAKIDPANVKVVANEPCMDSVMAAKASVQVPGYILSLRTMRRKT